LPARVCKICTRPFALSFAFVPVREPHSHSTRHDQTRSGTPSLPSCCAANMGVRTLSTFQYCLSPDCADFVIVNLDLIDDGANGRAPEARIARKDERITLTKAAIFSSVIRARGSVSATARSNTI
jgi:hypothetical protein